MPWPVFRKLGAMMLVGGAVAIGPGAAHADGPFGTIGGSWHGSGHIVLEGGRREDIRCNAYYTPKDGGSAMGLAIRCASPDYKIELRSQLNHDGRQVTGQWEERTFNATGAVTGRASTTQIQLQISGGALTGSMQVNTSGSTQTVSISTTGSTLQGVSIRPQRS
jgi:hypothetical protein